MKISAMAACVLVTLAAASCASRRGIDTGDFPRAASSAGGAVVTMEATLVEMRAEPAPDYRMTVNMPGRRTWTVILAVTGATPRIPPFVQGRKVLFSVENPVVFFMTNDARGGMTVKKTLSLWRSEYGRLYAEER